MEYEASLVPVDKLPLSASGVLMPLCNDCVRGDCTNPIREKTVAILGKPVKMRLWVVGNVFRAVVACNNGYIGAKDELGDDTSNIEEKASNKGQIL